MTGFRLGFADLQALVEQAQRLDEFEASLAALMKAGPADTASIVDFFEIPGGDAFDVAPEKAVEFFKAKGLEKTWHYGDLIGKHHDHAFTIAKMMDVDLLGQVRASLDSAMANGTSFAEWSKEITPTLQKAGWWGKKKKFDPDTGRLVEVQLGAPWRLQTIFRTNMQSAYAAGAWDEIQNQAEIAPFLMYDAIDDLRTRPLHKAWDQTVLPVSSAWWQTHYPPNGWNCRCGVIQLDADQVKALGLKVSATPPNDGNYTWVNPRTGFPQILPKGIDPGFANNSGETFVEDAKKLLEEKLASLNAGQQAAVRAAMKAANEATTAAQAAQAEVAAAAAKAALERAQAVVAEKAKQWQAQAELEAIGKGNAGAGALAAFKVKALQQLKTNGAWLEAKAADQLQQVNDMAAQLKAKTDLSKTLSLYKTQILAGKVPSPAAAKAFASLPEGEQAAFLAKIEKEKAAIIAKKAAEEAAAAAEAAKKAELAKPVVPATVAGEAPDPAALTKIGEQKGSNPGGTYQDTTTGAKWYIKQPASAEVARNEVLAGKLYELTGIEVPEMHLVTLDGKVSIASRIVDGLVKAEAPKLAAAAGTAEGFAVDAWLANWDVVGMGYDNLLMRGARAFRVDTGGALRFRAQGGLKGAAFGDSVTEFDSLRDLSKNRQAQAVFGRLTQAQIEESAVRVLKVSDADVRAIVERYGPEDAAERAALADRLISRKRDIARRYPEAAKRAQAELGAAEAPPAQVGRVTATEQAEVEASRVNGYAFSTDTDQIEDHSVLVHTLKRADGAEATRGFFKVMPGAGSQLLDRIKAAAGDSPEVQIGQARDSILAAIKSINFRADKGNPFDATVVSKIDTAKKAVHEALDQIAKARQLAASAAEVRQLNETADILETWFAKLEAVRNLAAEGKPAVKIAGMFPAGQIPNSITYTIKAKGPAVEGLKWKRVEGQFTFDAARFSRSYATETTQKAIVSGVQLRYEAELADGTKIVYFPHDPKVAWAMQGVMTIDVAGKGLASTGRIFEAIESAGINAARATELDRQHLYLNAFARLRLLRGDMLVYRKEFDAVVDKGTEGVRQKLDILKRATGVDVEKSDAWKNVDGVRQAFGHGRARQLRPDLDTQAFREFDRDFYLFHNPQGLGQDSGSGVFERLKMVIDGGGYFAPLVDRFRRGVPLSGSSVSSDLMTGGGDYHFTRIAARGPSGYGTGVYWKSSVLRRMDAITYDSDQFGRTTAGHIESNRLGQDVASLKAAARSSGNETIFKGGLSIFDDVDRIVLSNAAEVADAIAWMKTHGYTTWPDGRKLDEVIITRQAHAKRR